MGVARDVVEDQVLRDKIGVGIPVKGSRGG